MNPIAMETGETWIFEAKDIKDIKHIPTPPFEKLFQSPARGQRSNTFMCRLRLIGRFPAEVTEGSAEFIDAH